ncbi:MAG: hypothetical protein RL648_700 [Verrucomicrobiota bacterium]|jgi:membrane-bound serine protease (ClpP class)
MSLIIGLALTAFILFFFEIFVPGGVLAMAGGLFLLAASVVTYTEYGFIWAIALFFLGLIAAIGLFFLEIRFITHTPFGKQLSLQSTISARLNPLADEKLVGEAGVTLTTLSPGGKVRVKGAVHTAAALGGFLDKGTPVRVVRIEPFKLIVEKT